MNRMSFRRRILLPLLVVLGVYFTGFAASGINGFNIENLRHAARLLGFSFTNDQMEMMMPSVRVHLQSADAIRSAELSNDVPMSLYFDPLPPGYETPVSGLNSAWVIPDNVVMPEDREQLAFFSIPELASLVRSQKVSSEELTVFFLQRLEKYGDTLECVVTLTRDRALEQARKADEEIAGGNYRGPLHGIPYGVKDLFSVEGYPTSWGAEPYRDQYIGTTASVVKKLDEAGAVLVAKLTLGALAMGDVWYGGLTRNPWNPEQGSSGSSAGSAAAVSAGLLPFSIGTETLGSLVSPATRCGISSLRPTFGRVSRSGAMALSWSMDKVGPMARSVEDNAMVFDVIRGVDGLDKSLVDAGFYFDYDMEVTDLRVGYIKDFFDGDYPGSDLDNKVLDDLRDMGIELIPVDWQFNLPVNALRVILMAEAAASFDKLTTTGTDSLLVNQEMNAWPNLFRAARFIPAVEYINANRLRSRLVIEVNDLLSDFDVIVTPSYGGNQLLVTNLTGHPCLVVPNGFTNPGSPHSISFIGRLFEEDRLLALGHAWQKNTAHHLKHPPLFGTSLDSSEN